MAKHYDTLSHNVWLPYTFATGPVFKKFYDGLMDKKILGNVCPKCNKTLVPARTFCPECQKDMEAYTEVSTQGELRTWMLATKPFKGMPVDPPFVGAMIRLDGTDCDFLHLVGGIDMSDRQAVRDKLKPGLRVEAVWAEERRGHMLDIQYFRPM